MILSPIGYVIQDVVADEMTVEAVPNFNEQGINYSNEEIKVMHKPFKPLEDLQL